MRRALAFGLPDVSVRFSAWALKLIDRMILQAYLPLSVVGIYSVGYMLGSSAFELIGSSVNAALLPFFYSRATEDPRLATRRVFADVAAWEAALLGWLALGAILFAREFILLFTTAKYLEAEPIVPIIVWGAVFQNLAHVPFRAIYTAKRTAMLPVAFAVPALANIALNLVLIPPFGIFGAAWATLAAYPLMLLFVLRAAQHVYPIPYQYGRMVRVLALALALCVASRWLPAESSAVILLLKAVTFLSFPVVVALGGFPTAAERQICGQLLRRVNVFPGPARRSPRQSETAPSAPGPGSTRP